MLVDQFSFINYGQFLVQQASVGHEALLAVIPDPVTCFATARYTQKQVFRVSSDSNLVLVDWFTSGRYESGERWEFGLYKSTNNIFYEDGQPLFLDTVSSFLFVTNYYLSPCFDSLNPLYFGLVSLLDFPEAGFKVILRALCKIVCTYHGSVMSIISQSQSLLK